jgi:CBS domain-containing protein
MPIGAFARLYALRHELDVTHTLERLDALVERQALPPASRDEIAAAYDFLMRLRLRGQAQAVHQGEPPDNRVLLRRLGYSEKALLRQAFVQIAAVQHRIRYEFLGGT